MIDVGKRILRLPRFTANSVPLMALNWPSTRCCCLCAKLSFLHKVCCGESDTLSSEVYKTLSCSDVESMVLVKQCRFLELQYSSNFTTAVLTNVDSMRSLKKRVIKADRTLLLGQAKDHPSQSLVAQVASSVGRMRIWDTAPDHGPDGTTAVLSILELICKTALSDRVCCPMDECKCVIPTDYALCEHFLAQHTDLDVDIDSIIEKLCCCSEDLLCHGRRLSKFV